jgi:hypothetical protein
MGVAMQRRSTITTHCSAYFSSEAALVQRLAALQQPARVSPWSCAGCLAMVQKASAKPNLMDLEHDRNI